ncbi:facilitated trehalose transporter Tret1 [Nilaparvata lugens]|uniref:facilitated trehalose transporter Tret1 n=1 Tax=Nilaparvata lugens TaxID=108931 RepID=UPI00193EBC3B|nr:facilitated trehalose transporter Tret1 [Nilaparvata lugens]XP_039278681.1 facilitated trehalose transporter Tret1 [Nilaparvata lugens]
MASTSEESAATPLLSAGKGNLDENKSPLKKHAFIAFVIALPSIAPGMCLGFSAETLPQLDLGVSDAAWFASVIALMIPIGYLLSKPVMERFGRRVALHTVSVVGLLGWLMLSFRPTDPTTVKLYLGRMLTGVSVGLAMLPAATYANESLKDAVEQTSIVTWSTVALCFGILVTYICGAMIPYYQVAGVAAIISVFSLLAVAIFVPESPAWLQTKGRQGDAEWVQKQLGASQAGSSTDPEQSSPSAPPAPAEPQPTSLKEIMKEIEKPEVHKPLLIMSAFFFFQQFSGVFVFIAYMVDIVRSAGVIALNPYFVTVLSGVIIFGASIVASFVYPKTGVRALATLSGAGMCITMLFIAVYLSLRPYFFTRAEYYYLRWIPLIAILVNITSSTFGFLILPWSMLGEVFPLNVKGTAGAIATTLGYIFCFIAIISFPHLWLSMGSDGVFYFYGFSALLGTLFVYYFLPETHGKTLEEVLDGFSKKKKEQV